MAIHCVETSGSVKKTFFTMMLFQTPSPEAEAFV